MREQDFIPAPHRMSREDRRVVRQLSSIFDELGDVRSESNGHEVEEKGSILGRLVGAFELRKTVRLKPAAASRLRIGLGH